MVASIASAAPETKTTGPYEVSFDMNTALNYTVQLAQPYKTPTETIYPLMIKTDNKTLAQLSIVESMNLTDSTMSTGKIIIELGMKNAGYFKNISASDMVIDGKKGFIVAGENSEDMRIFQAYYWLDSRDCGCGPVSVGKTGVEISSSYPQNETMNLLKSLHVVNTKKTAKSLVL